MDTFARNAFLAIAAIAFIGIVGMYFVDSNSGAWAWANVPRDGYCRCITGAYEAGAFPNYYGGKGMEFKGFTTFDGCVQLCGQRYSWIPR